MTFTRAIFLTAALLSFAVPLPAQEWTALDDGLRASDTVLVGGQPTEAVLREAAAAGIEVVVNMRGVNEDPGFDEEALAAELGLTYLRVPIAGPQDLSPESVMLFDAVLKQVGDRPSLMHCASGNRVGAMYALHASRYDDLEPEAAIEIGKAHGLKGLEGAVREKLEQQ